MGDPTPSQLEAGRQTEDSPSESSVLSTMSASAIGAVSKIMQAGYIRYNNALNATFGPPELRPYFETVNTCSRKIQRPTAMDSFNDQKGLSQIWSRYPAKSVADKLAVEMVLRHCMLSQEGQTTHQELSDATVRSITVLLQAFGSGDGEKGEVTKAAQTAADSSIAAWKKAQNKA